MQKIKVAIIFGTRPEAIKLAPLIAELQCRSDRFCPVVIVTGQHRHLLDQVLALFEIVPDYDLNVMTHAQSLSEITSRVLQGLEAILTRECPALTLVQGDTTTAFATALASFYFKTPIGHVEAGLRTYNYQNPFPEEANRRLIDLLADLYFAPTQQARENLLAEGVPSERICQTGNTVIDALLKIINVPIVLSDYPCLRPIDFESSTVITVTMHRRESFGEPMQNVFSALHDIVNRFPQIEIVFLVHPNPNVYLLANRILQGEARIHLIEPLPYPAFVHLMNRSRLILTDSGGLQEEASALGKPVLVLRETTERPEVVEAGGARIVGTRRERVVDAVETLLTDRQQYDAMAQARRLYGDGTAAERIADFIEGIPSSRLGDLFQNIGPQGMPV